MIRNRIARIAFAPMLVLSMSLPAAAETIEVARDPTPEHRVSLSLRREAGVTIDATTRWLLAQQQERGNWSNPGHPALTALPLFALQLAGVEASEATAKARDFILSTAHDDGSFWVRPEPGTRGGGLTSYNTAVSLMALHSLGDPDLTPVLLRARSYLAGLQHRGDDVYDGGFGYDAQTDRAYADLSNTIFATMAMRLTEDLEDLRRDAGEAPADLDWEAVETFVTRLINHDGGFIYRPGHSMAGEETLEDGTVRLRSYASMTYAGLLSLIYAEVDPEDKRVQSAFDWARNHWSLEENPGMGQEGYYYFLSVMAKALNEMGVEEFQLPTGHRINWREAMVRQILNLKRTDTEGRVYWTNPTSRWMESDPVLVTSYALMALSIALGGA